MMQIAFEDLARLVPGVGSQELFYRRHDVFVLGILSRRVFVGGGDSGEEVIPCQFYTYLPGAQEQSAVRGKIACHFGGITHPALLDVANEAIQQRDSIVREQYLAFALEHTSRLTPGRCT